MTVEMSFLVLVSRYGGGVVATERAGSHISQIMLSLTQWTPIRIKTYFQYKLSSGTFRREKQPSR